MAAAVRVPGGHADRNVTAGARGGLGPAARGLADARVARAAVVAAARAARVIAARQTAVSVRRACDGAVRRRVGAVGVRIDCAVSVGAAGVARGGYVAPRRRRRRRRWRRRHRAARERALAAARVAVRWHGRRRAAVRPGRRAPAVTAALRAAKLAGRGRVLGLVNVTGGIHPTATSVRRVVERHPGRVLGGHALRRARGATRTEFAEAAKPLSEGGARRRSLLAAQRLRRRRRRMPGWVGDSRCHEDEGGHFGGGSRERRMLLWSIPCSTA